MTHIRNYNFNTDSTKKFPHQFFITIDDLPYLETWMKESFGKYGERWMWWGARLKSIGNANGELYLRSSEDAMAFRLRWT